MTLIVGWLCEDAVVVAADGAATLGYHGVATAQQGIRKLHRIGTQCVSGCSGPVGLSQMYRDRLTELDKGRKLSSNCPSPVDAVRRIEEAFRQDLMPRMQAAQVTRNVLGPATANASVQGASIVGFVHKKRPYLAEFDANGAGELRDQDVPFVAIGSGQATADPFLAFVRRIFWDDGRLTSVSEGIFASYWAIDHTIRTNPGLGVAPPIQVMVLDQSGAKELSQEELSSHQEAVTNAEEHLRSYAGILAGGSDGPPSEPPTP